MENVDNVQNTQNARIFQKHEWETRSEDQGAERSHPESGEREGVSCFLILKLKVSISVTAYTR